MSAGAHKKKNKEMKQQQSPEFFPTSSEVEEMRCLMENKETPREGEENEITTRGDVQSGKENQSGGVRTSHGTFPVGNYPQIVPRTVLSRAANDEAGGGISGSCAQHKAHSGRGRAEGKEARSFR